MKKIVLGIVTVLIFSINLFGHSSKHCKYTIVYLRVSGLFMQKNKVEDVFIAKVNQLLGKGWEVQGGMAGARYNYIQALIKCPQ